MSNFISRFTFLTDKLVDIFFKDILMIEEIPILKKHDPQIFQSHNSPDLESQNNNFKREETNFNSDSELGELEKNMFHQRNSNNDSKNSNEKEIDNNNNNNVFIKLSSEKQDFHPINHYDNNKNLLDKNYFNINNDYQMNNKVINKGTHEDHYDNQYNKEKKDNNDINKKNDSQQENTSSENLVNYRISSPQKNLTNIDNNLDEKKIKRNNNDETQNDNNSFNIKLKKTDEIKEQTEEDVENINKMIFQKINVKDDTDKDPYFNNNLGMNFSENILNSDINSQRSRGTLRNQQNKIPNFNRSVGKYSQNTNRNQLRKTVGRANNFGYDTNQFNENDYEIEIKVDEENLPKLNNESSNLEKLNKDTDSKRNKKSSKFKNKSKDKSKN